MSAFWSFSQVATSLAGGAVCEKVRGSYRDLVLRVCELVAGIAAMLGRVPRVGMGCGGVLGGTQYWWMERSLMSSRSRPVPMSDASWHSSGVGVTRCWLGEPWSHRGQRCVLVHCPCLHSASLSSSSS